MSYGDLIKDAFWLTLRNRYLWFFGFFAGGTSANPNVLNIPSGSFDDTDFDQRSSVPVVVEHVRQSMFKYVALVMALGTLVLLIVLVFIALSLVSQGALAESAAAIDRGESRRFSSAFRTGLSDFWRVLGYYLLFLLIGFGFLLVIGVPLALLVAGVIASTESIVAQILTVVLAVLAGLALLIDMFIPLSIIGQFALREIVVGRERVFGSIGSAYRLFRYNLGKSLLCCG